MKTYLAISLSLLLVACAAQAQMQSATQSKDEQSFKLCESEGFFALSLARQYLMGGKKREAVLPYISNSKDDQDMANEAFSRFDSGELKHHANFAVEKLYACAKKEGASITVPKNDAAVCFAKVDIPFFLSLEKGNGLTKQEAINSVDKRLSNKNLYPRDLIIEVANKVFTSMTDEQNGRTQRALFWSCMYP